MSLFERLFGSATVSHASTQSSLPDDVKDVFTNYDRSVKAIEDKQARDADDLTQRLLAVSRYLNSTVAPCLNRLKNELERPDLYVTVNIEKERLNSVEYTKTIYFSFKPNKVGRGGCVYFHWMPIEQVCGRKIINFWEDDTNTTGEQILDVTGFSEADIRRFVLDLVKQAINYTS